MTNNISDIINKLGNHSYFTNTYNMLVVIYKCEFMMTFITFNLNINVNIIFDLSHMYT